MSVFRVNLDQGVGRTKGGYLDTATSGGYSLQRSIYAPGPNKINRRLIDGSTFTDVNYWKRFTTDSLPAEQAFIEVITDDGSVWNDFSDDNNFPRSYHVVIADNSAYAANVVDILGDNGSAAIFTQITVAVSSSGTAPTFRFNGLSNATLSIGNGTTQVFDKGDLQITYIEIDNTQSGHQAATADIFVSVKSTARS